VSPKSRSLLRPERRASRLEEMRAERLDACDEVRLSLLNGFALLGDPGRKQLPLGAQRVVVFIALHERPLLRGYVAGSLWLDSTEERAAANLRSALWRIHRIEPRLIDTSGHTLQLGREVSVDLREMEATAHALLRDDPGVEPEVSRLTGDVLPDWYDDWVIFERERFRQLRLRALEALCDRLTRAGRLAEALEVGLRCVAGEPLRESAHRAVMRVYLADGNPGQAIRQYQLCERVFGEQLGIRPSSQIQNLLPRS
jgi:DNA-binding SARP family transcriptional activator